MGCDTTLTLNRTAYRTPKDPGRRQCRRRRPGPPNAMISRSSALSCGPPPPLAPPVEWHRQVHRTQCRSAGTPTTRRRKAPPRRGGRIPPEPGPAETGGPQPVWRPNFSGKLRNFKGRPLAGGSDTGLPRPELEGPRQSLRSGPRSDSFRGPGRAGCTAMHYSPKIWPQTGGRAGSFPPLLPSSPSSPPSESPVRPSPPPSAAAACPA
jgi:hypothetical protein